MCDVMSKKRWICLAVVMLLVLTWTVTIFAQSAKNGEESTDDTNKIMKIIENIAEKLGLDAEISAHVLRKLAHFGEYMILGLLVASVAGILGKTLVYPCAWGYTIAVALVDEFVIQSMTEGRGPSIKDVGIDAAGALVGVLLVMGAAWWLCQRRLKRRG